jgi:hypothetical protein
VSIITHSVNNKNTLPLKIAFSGKIKPFGEQKSLQATQPHAVEIPGTRILNPSF